MEKSVEAPSGRHNAEENLFWWKELLSENGKIVFDAINNIPQKYDNVYVDCFVIMPNHIHMIIGIGNRWRPLGTDTGEGTKLLVQNAKSYSSSTTDFSGNDLTDRFIANDSDSQNPEQNMQTTDSGNSSANNQKNIGHIINQLKGFTSKTIGYPVWQRSYYDHIIRDENDLLTKSNYIHTNPLKWAEDEFFTY